MAQWWPRCLEEAKACPDCNEQAQLELALVTLSLIATESGGRVDAVGDNGHSVGLFQLHDQGAGKGLTVEQRQDPNVQFKKLMPEIINSFRQHWPDGKTGAALATAVGKDAERPIAGAEVKYGQKYNELRAGVPW